MLDVVTFGSASRDIFVETNKSVQEKGFLTKEGIYLSLGSKIDIKDIHSFSGGGGTNSSFTFANMGFKTAYYGAVGKDYYGEEILKELKDKKITSFIYKDKVKKTNQSIVLNIKDKDRTILVYRGASENLKLEKLPPSKLIYIAPLSGKASFLFEKIIKNTNAKVASNLGNSQLSLPRIREIIKKIDILILNQEEASILTKESYKNEKKIIDKIRSFYNGVFVMTKGPMGSLVIKDKKAYRAGIINKKVVDRTGAGDAFGSAFVSEYIRSNDIVKSIQLATANSASIMGKWGAKEGLLKKGDKFKKIKVNSYEIS